MNTKDNQEAERKAFEELKFIDEKLRQSKKLDMSKVYGNCFLKHEKAIRATLSPQVNEEVASDNVLVEALEIIHGTTQAQGFTKEQRLKNITDIAQKALATYSASTDSAMKSS